MQPRKIIKNGVIAEDKFQYIADGSALPASGDIIVDVALWEARKSDLKNRDGRVGVLLQGDAEPDAIIDDLRDLAVIAIQFPVFRDGRGFSLARILRDRLGYKGELRAVGDVLRDQLFFMQRCGFNAFEPRADRCIEQALKGLTDFTVVYQADANEKRPIYRRRPA
ncbi:MAG: DUF934 domain-containing protein [Gammaproteobacteria bacterium]